MNIYIHIDDVGLTKGFTKTAKILTEYGTVNSISFRTNGTDFEQAIKQNYPNTVLGLHFNLTDGKGNIKYLIDKNGIFKFNFLHYLAMSVLSKKSLKRAIIKELNEQYRKIFRYGIRITRIDSHDHVHMIPWIFALVCQFCDKKGVPVIRLASEPWHNKSKFFILPFIKYLLLKLLTVFDIKILRKYKVITHDAFYGILQTNNMNEKTILSCLDHAKQNRYSSIEILAHPAIVSKNIPPYTSGFIAKYANQKNRIMEYKALASKKLKNQVLLLRKRHL